MRLIDADFLLKLIKENDYMLVVDNLNSRDYGMFTTGIEQAIDLTPTVEPMQWISVKYRLPRSREVVVACDKYGKMITAVCTSGEFLYYDEEGYPHYLKGITHWMPLPEPPKGENE